MDIQDERQVGTSGPISTVDTSGVAGTVDPADPGPSDPEWLDRLVDMHVLSENGDAEAAAAAREWLDRDPEARRVWSEVQRTCELLHGPRGG